MKQQENAALAANSSNGISPTGDKGTKSPRGFHQKRVLNLLLEGGSYTAADITIALHLSDPRAHIRSLRKKGFPIRDVWERSVHSKRFKRYFLQREGAAGGTEAGNISEKQL